LFYKIDLVKWLAGTQKKNRPWFWPQKKV
jgi:hypothetical protein